MLEPCARCNRHIQDTETQCPFCGAANDGRQRRPIAMLEGRLSRAAVFASALVAPACVVNDPQPQYPPPPPPNYRQQPPPNYQQQPPPPDYAQPPPPDDQQQPPPQNTPPPVVADAAVHVTVRFANGQPYVGEVEVHGASTHTSPTSANGDLVLKNLVPGNYTITVNDPVSGNRVQQHVRLNSNSITRVNLVAPVRAVRRYNPNNIPKPYGAPPYRKRVV